MYIQHIGIYYYNYYITAKKKKAKKKFYNIIKSIPLLIKY